MYNKQTNFVTGAFLFLELQLSFKILVRFSQELDVLNSASLTHRSLLRLCCDERELNSLFENTFPNVSDLWFDKCVKWI